eukprot:9165500-Pyramimonas_sp.AAC.1
MERKHRAPKRFANERQNTKSFERSLIEDITCQHLFELKYELEGLDLLEPRPAIKNMLRAICSAMRVRPGAEVVSIRSA